MKWLFIIWFLPVASYAAKPFEATSCSQFFDSFISQPEPASPSWTYHPIELAGRKLKLISAFKLGHGGHPVLVLLNEDGTEAADLVHATTGEFTVIQTGDGRLHFFNNADGSLLANDLPEKVLRGNGSVGDPIDTIYGVVIDGTSYVAIETLLTVEFFGLVNKDGLMMVSLVNPR